MKYMNSTTQTRLTKRAFIGEMIRSPKPKDWAAIHSLLFEESLALRLEHYPVVSTCHCVAVSRSKDCGTFWVPHVLRHLTELATQEYSLSAYVVGSQLGLFQAALRLRAKKRIIKPATFLKEIADYCTAIWSKPARFATSCTGAMPDYSEARSVLDHAVKEFMRPNTLTSDRQQRSQIRAMLVALNDIELDTTIPRELHDPRTWLVDSLINAALDVGHLSRHDRLVAALAVNQ